MAGGIVLACVGASADKRELLPLTILMCKDNGCFLKGNVGAHGGGRTRGIPLAYVRDDACRCEGVRSLDSEE